MAVKRHLNKKVNGHKKVASTISASARHASNVEVASQSPQQEAIIRQFHRIQRGYSIFMNEIIKELDLVKKMIKKEAMNRRNEIKEKLNSRLSRT